MVVFHFLLPINVVIPLPFNLVGIPLFLVGATLALSAKRLFKTTNTPIKPFDPPIRLHQNGMFSISRNPMYLGIFIGLLGIAVFLGSLVTFAFPLLFLLIMNFTFVPYEERVLDSAFGEEYLMYKKKVRRWLWPF